MSKGMTRSSSYSSQYLKDSKNQIFHKKNKTPKPNEIQEFSLEKHSSTEILTVDSTLQCKFCSAPKIYESRIAGVLEDISETLSGIISGYNSWKNLKNSKIKPNLVVKNNFSSVSSSPKLEEIHKLCKKINDILIELTSDIEVLSKSSPWKNVSLRKPAQNNLCLSVKETISAAQQHLSWLKNNSSIDIFEKSENRLTRCLQLELEQSFRDRRGLEAQLLVNSNSSSEHFIKSLERVIQEHQTELNI